MFCYDCSCNIRFIFTNTKLHIFRIPKNQNIPNTPLTCLNFSFSIRPFQLELFATEGRKKPVNSSIVDLTPRHKNTRLVSSGASLTSWGEGASLALIGHPSSDGVTIKILYGVDGVDVLHRPACPPSFPIGLVNASGSRDYCWCLSFFGFLRPDLSPWGYRNRCFLVALSHVIVRRANLKV